MKRFLVYIRKIKELNATKKAYFIAFLALAFILLWAFLSAGFLTTDFSRSQLKSGGKRQSLDVSSMILTETKDNIKYWEIYGETGSYDSDEKIALLNNVIGNFYKDNEVTMSVESSKGSYNEEKGQIILYENTNIVIKDGTSLNCDRLVWSGTNENIVAKHNVKISRNGELIVTGEEVIINPTYDHFKIKGHTQTKLFDKNNSDKHKKGTLFQ